MYDNAPFTVSTAPAVCVVAPTLAAPAPRLNKNGWPDSPAVATQGVAMNMQISLAPIIALLAGILILVKPRLLNYIVAVYLIVIGVLGLFGGSGGLNLR